MAGKPWTDEQKARARRRMFGSTLPAHHRTAIAAAQIGRPVSAVTRAKIGAANRKTPDECFWPYVSPEPNSGCWLWTAQRDADGYGIVTIRRGERRAHRYAYATLCGPIAIGLQVQHACDTPACVNPRHLSLGTSLKNISDMVLRGRAHYLRGEQNPAARLTTDAVQEIRRRAAGGAPVRSLRHEFGIGHHTIYALLRRDTWTHI